MRDLILVAAGAAIGFAGVFVFMLPDKGTSALASFGQNCSIKGNVSIGSGERIYHVPGQEFYAETVIRPEYGERWFCSEAEARSAGWRRSRT
jgi:hypothetical protein